MTAAAMDQRDEANATPPQQPSGIVLTEAQKKRRRERSIAIALALGILVVLFFAVTLAKGPAVMMRPI